MDRTENSSDKLIYLREITTSIVGLVILATSIYMLISVFQIADKDQVSLDAFSRKKDVLLYVLGFLGTVTGYYLGRSPAERAADAARNAQKKAEQSEAKTKQIVRDGLNNLRDSTMKGGNSTDQSSDSINKILNSINY